QPAGAADQPGCPGSTHLRRRFIIRIGVVWEICVLVTVYIRLARARRGVTVVAAGLSFSPLASGPGTGRHRTPTAAGLWAAAQVESRTAIVGSRVVGPRHFRSWAVLVVWPRAVPRIGVPGVVIPGVVIPGVVEGWPVGWVGAVFDDGVDAGEQAGEDVAVGEALVGAVDEPDEQVGPQLVHPVWMPRRFGGAGEPVEPVAGGGDLVDGQVLAGQIGGAGLVA